MKLVEIETIQIEVVNQETGLARRHMVKRTINPEMICSLDRANIPSGIAGPTGEPTKTEGTVMGIIGIGEILLEAKVEEVIQALGIDFDKLEVTKVKL